MLHSIHFLLLLVLKGKLAPIENLLLKLSWTLADLLVEAWLKESQEVFKKAGKL